MDVLVVDDNPAVRTSLARVLRRTGYRVNAVENGLAALAEIQRTPYGLVICDIQMPYLDGIQLFDRLAEEYPDVARRVLFMTAWIGDARIRRFLDTSGRPYLEKPFELSDLVAAVRQLAEQP